MPHCESLYFYGTTIEFLYFDINQRQPGWSSDSTYIYCAIAVEIDICYLQTLLNCALWDFIPKRPLPPVNIVFSSISFTAFTWLHQLISGYKAQIKLVEWLPDMIIAWHFCQSNCATHRTQSLLEGSLDFLQADCSDLSFRAQWLPELRFKNKKTPEICPHNGYTFFELLWQEKAMTYLYILSTVFLLGAFAKLLKTTISFAMSVSPFVRLSAWTTRLPLEDFHKIL